MNWIYNKKILLTGASSGIGKALATLLIKKYNCSVIGVNRSQDKLEEFKRELGEYGDKFSYYPMDASKLENWQQLYKTLQDKNEQIDVLINNAGMMHPFMSFEKIEIEQVHKVMNINFYSAIYSVKTFLPMLNQSKTPAIINISSASALANVPGVSVYGASKSALRAFSETISYEFRKHIYVCTVMPGFVKTNLFYSKDNAKNIVDDNDMGLINKFCMKVDKMAKKTVRAIKRKRKRVVLGLDGKFINFMHKLMPVSTTKLMGGVFRASKRKTFDQIFDVNFETNNEEKK